MGVPWNYGPEEFRAAPGSATVVELKVPHRGTIKRLTLNQVNGNDAAEFQIFASRPAADIIADNSEYSSGSSTSSTGDSQVVGAHSLFGVKNVVAGVFTDYAMDVIYRNADGTSTNPVRRLWLVISPAGVGDNTYSLAMTIEQAELNS